MPTMKRKAVYAASLDPITNGHLNVIERVAPLYDELIVVVAVDPRKTYMFSAEERVRMATSAVAHLKNVTVDVCIGQYVVKFADSACARVIIRGLRNFKDLDDEQVLAEENRRICPNIETVWVPCLPNLMHVSSSMVKTHVGADPNWEEQAGRSVSADVVKMLKEKYILSKAKKHWASLMAAVGNPFSGNPKGSEKIFKGILSAYSEGHRAYHNLEHIVNMLDELDTVADQINDIEAVKMAVWYHDIVYKVTTKEEYVPGDNELHSGLRAKLDIEKLGLTESLIKRVYMLIKATEHRGAVSDSDAMYLVDLDLAILGKPEKEFECYERGIRTEYAVVPSADFYKGRAAVMKSFLDREKIYCTEEFQKRYEDAARKNLTRPKKTLAWV